MRLSCLKLILIRILFLILPVISFADDDYNATKVADNLNLAYNDYNFLMGLSGVLVGFVILYFSIKVVIK